MSISYKLQIEKAENGWIIEPTKDFNNDVDIATNDQGWRAEVVEANRPEKRYVALTDEEAVNIALTILRTKFEKPNKNPIRPDAEAA